ncbi:glycerophosphodiester phosphodiesterase family protein [Nocardia terpenica]|uniref:glycerophosphodiester phosphodiesterase family protein n=1 Tax=Nocardia terpenica TaxID=455432 RepID=UPI0002E88CEC|nr:glycerophosphodiester phosphodiesterase family protein [Nocardia terpenica]NQE91308.1 glycerophosphodiester phosphodiesterase [Nocardia terpenica]
MRRRVWSIVVAGLSIVSTVGVGGCGGESSAPDKAPMIVAHRGGTGDMPENTLAAIDSALRNHADAIWLSVQASADGEAVLYRPQDLSAQTDGNGPVAAKPAAELARLNAGYAFVDGNGNHPYRDRPTPIPTLREALAAIPAPVPIFLDLKQLPPDPVVSATARTLRETGNLDRATIYSTSGDVIAAAAAQGLHVAESRDKTRQRLLDVALRHACDRAAARPQTWIALELHLKVAVTEKVTLGSATTDTEAQLWDPESVRCLRSDGNAKLMAIGVATKADYDTARQLGIDAVLVDSPATAQTWR